MFTNTLDILHSDWFIHNIQQHILPKEFCILKYVSKFYYTNITDNLVANVIIKNIDRRLKKVLGSSYNMFIKYISVNNIAISGSFIIQCILDEYFEDSDIDLYAYADIDEDQFFDVILKDQYTEDDIEGMVDNYGNLPRVFEVINAHLASGQKLQKIHMSNPKINNPNKLLKYIIKSFDMDVCKNIFMIINGIPKLYIHNIWKIICKQDTIKINIFRKMETRINKYELRNFKFNYDLELTNYIKHDYYHSPFLVCKYNDRNKLEAISFLNKMFTKNSLKKIFKKTKGIMTLQNEENDVKHNKLENKSRTIIDWKSNNIELINDSAVTYACTTEDTCLVNDTIYTVNMCTLFKAVYNNVTLRSIERNRCNCCLDTTFGIKHTHVHCKIQRSDISNFTRKIDFIQINYNDLNTKFKSGYDKLFATKTFSGKFLDSDDIGKCIF